MNYKSIFKKLLDNRMAKADVKVCLQLPQSEFLNVLLYGARAHIENEISRADLAELAEVSNKSIYSYFASPDARDFRRLTDEMRIAMIWRVTNNVTPPTHREYKVNKKHYLYHGERVSLAQAATRLNFSHANSLSAALRRLGVKNGEEISHLTNKHPGKRGGMLFVVDGELLTIRKAAEKLGFRSHQGLRINLAKHKLQEGEDISFLRRRNR
ncbi:hypothetical protein CAV59_02875 [Salmonella enterica]|nr:hypothetical protein [Salmonella enterica]MIL91745.1 hypothetical protein [Salmonella enterica]